MKPLPREIVASARTNFGLVTLADLRRAEFGDRQRAIALRHGELIELHRGVYRIASHPVTFEQRCRAAVLAAPDAALSGPTAARLCGLRKATTNEVHVLARRTIVLHDVTAHRTCLLSDADVHQLGPFRVLRPARLACDLARYLDDEALESAVEDMLNRRLLALDVLRPLARTFVRSGRDGSARLGRVLDSRPTWRRPAESDIELRLMRALASRGLDVRPQIEVALDSGRVIRLDLADETIRFGIEVDHSTWHGGRLDVQRDKQRDRESLRVGWTIARVTDEDVVRRLDHTADELVAIAEAMRRRGPKHRERAA
jgi:very-short-patch-repair endonuclease